MPSISSSSPARVRSANRRQHQVICDGCGVFAILSFRPRKGKAVYCNPCFSVQRPELASMEGATASKSSIANGQAVCSTPAHDARVCWNVFEEQHKGGYLPHEHNGSNTHSGEGYSASHGRTRLDWSGSYWIRKDPRVRDTDDRAVRSVVTPCPRACAGTHTGTSHSGGQSCGGTGFFSTNSRYAAVWGSVSAT